MKKGLAALLILLGSYVLPPMAIHAAEEPTPAPAEEKPLGPGWLSLDCCVGVLDGKIADGKGAVEKAVGIGISGYFDTKLHLEFKLSEKSPSISGRYFDKDYNKIEFNDFI